MKDKTESLGEWIDTELRKFCMEKGITMKQLHVALIEFKEKLDKEIEEYENAKNSR